jgi:ABC-type polysaccharide/polyol phosphate export permease
MNFPKITIILGSILATFSDFIISCALFAVVYVAFGYRIGFNSLYVPLILVVHIVFIVGISILFSVINVYLRDVQSAISAIVQVWMLASPVGYSLGMVGEKLRPYYLLNPMAGIIDSYRKTLLHNQPPDAIYLGTAAVISALLLVFGYWLFKKNEKNLADIISL